MTYSFQIEVHGWQNWYLSRQRNDSIRWGCVRVNFGFIDLRYMWSRSGI